MNKLIEINKWNGEEEEEEKEIFLREMGYFFPVRPTFESTLEKKKRVLLEKNGGRWAQVREEEEEEVEDAGAPTRRGSRGSSYRFSGDVLRVSSPCLDE